MHDTSVQSGLLDNQAISLDNNQDSQDPEETRSKAKVDKMYIDKASRRWEKFNIADVLFHLIIL